MKLFMFTESPHARSSIRNLKLIHILTLILIASALFLTLSPTVTAQTVHIPDPNLRAALELALDKEAGAEITRTEMASLESLEAFEAGILDLTGLEFALNLKELHFGLNHVSDMSSLKNLKKLTVLDLHRNENISNITPLKDLTNLTWLSLRGNKILDMSPLKNLINLTYLHIGYNRISDVTPLKKLIKLTFLNLDENRISDLSPLSVLSNLRYLAIDDNRIIDLSPLSVLTNLRYLNLNDNQISDISSLSVLVKLVFIDLHGNNVSDLTPLKNMTEMTNLRLQENHITDISPLRGMTKLIRLILHDNHIFDFSPIAGVIENLVEYDDSNQTEPPPHLQRKPAPNLADVNRDGVVDISDLILIALNFRDPDLESLANLNVYPDVNGDGAVDIIDLLLAASEMGATNNAAPTLIKNPAEISNLTVKNLTHWIHLAKQLETKEPIVQKGIGVLEHLLELRRAVETLPKKTALLKNYPNPFNPETWIPYRLAKPAKVVISIYSAEGKRVRKLVLGQLPAGVYQHKSRAAYWDGKNEFGESVSSGIYFYRLTADGFSAIGKMFIVK